MNNVIFLDIDGVLNSEEYFKNRTKDGSLTTDILVSDLDSDLISKLNKILSTVDVNIVLSSSWRVYGLDRVNKALKKKGFQYEIKYLTGKDKDRYRGKEICDFIQNNNVNNYIVIDDEAFDIKEYIPNSQFVKTTWNKGLEDTHVDYIINYFQNINNKDVDKMSSLKFLGKGNTSAYIKEGNSLLLIDCGETVFSKIREVNLLSDVKDLTILITHLHPDHSGSLGSLIFYCKYILDIKPKVIFPNKRLVELLRLQGIDPNFYELQCPDQCIETGEFEFIECNTNMGIIVIDINSVSHVEEISAYSYTLWYKEGKAIHYSGDTNNTSLIHKYVKKDYIKEVYVDTSLQDYEGNVHLSLSKLCQHIPASYRYKVYCMHLDSDELIDKAKKEGFNVVTCD